MAFYTLISIYLRTLTREVGIGLDGSFDDNSRAQSSGMFDKSHLTPALHVCKIDVHVWLSRPLDNKNYLLRHNYTIDDYVVGNEIQQYVSIHEDSIHIRDLKFKNVRFQI